MRAHKQSIKSKPLGRTAAVKNSSEEQQGRTAVKNSSCEEQQ
jgi:hypothetical protein